MIIFFVLGIVLGGVAVIFALQNIAVISVSFFTWQIEGSLAVILLTTVLVGIVATLLVLLPESISGYFKYKRLERENTKLAEELRRQKELTMFAKTTAPTPEVIARIENGAIEQGETLY